MTSQNVKHIMRKNLVSKNRNMGSRTLIWICFKYFYSLSVYLLCLDKNTLPSFWEIHNDRNRNITPEVKKLLLLSRTLIVEQDAKPRGHL